jgi:hypothetical protein
MGGFYSSLITLIKIHPNELSGSTQFRVWQNGHRIILEIF